MPEDQLLTAKQLSQLLCVSERQIFHLNNCGKLPAPILVGKRLRWKASAISEWLNASASDKSNNKTSEIVVTEEKEQSATAAGTPMAVSSPAPAPNSLLAATSTLAASATTTIIVNPPTISTVASPYLSEVIDYACVLGITEEKAKYYYDHYSAIGWVDCAGRAITDWRAMLRKWKARGYQFDDLIPKHKQIPKWKQEILLEQQKQKQQLQPQQLTKIIEEQIR